MRDLLAGTFNQLVKAVALAADNDGGDDAHELPSESRKEVGDGDISTEVSAGGQLRGQAAAEGEAADDSVEEDGEVRLVQKGDRGEGDWSSRLSRLSAVPCVSTVR